MNDIVTTPATALETEAPIALLTACQPFISEIDRWISSAKSDSPQDDAGTSALFLKQLAALEQAALAPDAPSFEESRLLEISAVTSKVSLALSKKIDNASLGADVLELRKLLNEFRFTIDQDSAVTLDSSSLPLLLEPVEDLTLDEESDLDIFDIENPEPIRIERIPELSDELSDNHLNLLVGKASEDDGLELFEDEDELSIELLPPDLAESEDELRLADESIEASLSLDEENPAKKGWGFFNLFG